MKNTHIIAVACFLASAGTYFLADVKSVGGLFFAAGVILELIGWKNLSGGKQKPDA